MARTTTTRTAITATTTRCFSFVTLFLLMTAQRAARALPMMQEVIEYQVTCTGIFTTGSQDNKDTYEKCSMTTMNLVMNRRSLSNIPRFVEVEGMVTESGSAPFTKVTLKSRKTQTFTGEHVDNGRPGSSWGSNAGPEFPIPDYFRRLRKRGKPRSQLLPTTTTTTTTSGDEEETEEDASASQQESKEDEEIEDEEVDEDASASQQESKGDGEVDEDASAFREEFKTMFYQCLDVNGFFDLLDEPVSQDDIVCSGNKI